MTFDKSKVSEQLEAKKELLLEKFSAFSRYVNRDKHQYLFCPYTIQSVRATLHSLWASDENTKGIALFGYSLKHGRQREEYWEILKEAILSQLEMESKAEINPDITYPNTGNPLRIGFADDLTGMLKGIIEI